MKTIAQTLLAALLLTAPTLATTANAAAMKRADEPTTANHTIATNAFRVAVYAGAKPMAINVVVEKQTPKLMIIRVVDQRGSVLEEQAIGRRQGNFQYRFNLSELADGTYSVEVISGTNKSSHPITLTTPTADRTLTVR
jgi:hypothetical protein